LRSRFALLSLIVSRKLEARNFARSVHRLENSVLTSAKIGNAVRNPVRGR
jgi:hypothetical protein